VAGLLSKFGDDLRERQRFAVGPIGGHGVKGITGMNDSRLDGDLLALQPIGIAAAIPAFVLGSDDGTQGSQERHGSEDAFTNDRVLAHDREFFGCERTRLLENVSGDADLSNVVE